MTQLPENMPSLAEILIKTDSARWREKSLKGISEKMLWRNEKLALHRADQFDKGAGIPSALSCVQSVHVLPAGPLRIHFEWS